jgi:flagella basal body P-ring formation protein FlgA
MNFIFKAFLSLFYLIQAQGLHAEGKLIFGSDLKKVAAERLAEEGISKTVLVSDKRAYFPCAEKIYISPKNENDWNTIKASCGSPSLWSVSLRTKNASMQKKGASQTDSSVQIVFTKQNIPKGKVIQLEDLEMKWASSRSTYGAYVKVENIIGHKAKRNIMRNSIIKTQHIVPMNAVNKNDTIIIASGSSGLSISTYGQALANGKLGDMILVKNLSSNKEFKAIITASKKVRPIY